MEITTQQAGDFIEVRAKGRLDGYWASHFSTALDEIVRQGNHHIRVNLSEINYISSMGIGVLVGCYKNLAAIQGVLVVTDPSPMVSKVIDMVGLRSTLMSEPAAVSTPSGAAAATISAHGDARYELYKLTGAGMQCSLIGDPGLLEGCRFTEANCKPVTFAPTVCGIGLGAFGGGFQECKDRFGEFLALAGAAAYQPSDGSNAADYMLGSNTFFPEVQVLYGISAEGAYGCMARFEAKSEVGAITLTALAAAAHEFAAAPAAWITIVAESAGLSGVSLRRSPVGQASACGGLQPASPPPFAHPEIRNWLSFTTERAHIRTLTVVTGLITAPDSPPLKTITRPLSRDSQLAGHLHAAAFSYRPLQKGKIDLAGTIRPLFEKETLHGILHLIGDDRESTGVSESEFVRGAIWIAPILGIEPPKEDA